MLIDQEAKAISTLPANNYIFKLKNKKMKRVSSFFIKKISKFMRKLQLIYLKTFISSRKISLELPMEV